MKIYNVYYKPKHLTPVLYGFSNNKDIIKLFKSQRKMSLYEIIEHDITKSEYNSILRDRSDLELQEKRLKTKDVDIPGIRSEVSLIMTNMEETSVYTHSDKVFLELSRFTSKDAFALNNSVIEALDTLGYFSIYKLQNYYDPFVSGVRWFDITEYEIDEFSVFLHIYGDVLSVK